MHDSQARRPLWAAGVVAGFAVLALVTYGPSLANAFVVFDDDLLITENPIVHVLSPVTVVRAFSTYDPELFIPLTLLHYQVAWLIGGGSPWIFHALQLLLHTANALLVVLCIRQFGYRTLLAVLCGALFLVHPINTEAVAWASALKDVLTTFFGLACIVSYQRWRHGRSHWYAVAVCCFVLGLAAKVSIILLPVALLMFDWRSKRTTTMREMMPFIIIAMIFGVIAVIGKLQDFGNTPLPATALLMAAGGVASLGRIVWPAGYSVLYPYTGTVSLWSAEMILPLLIVIALGIVTAASTRRTRDVATGAALSVLTFIPNAAHPLTAGDIYLTFDRYAYFPFIGVLIILAWVLSRPAWGQRAIPAAGVIVISGLAVLAQRQSRVWLSTETLFRNVLAHHDNSQLAYAKIGAIDSDAGNLETAQSHLERAISIRETARAYYNLGIIAILQKRTDDAITLNEQSVALDPQYAAPHLNLGYLYWEGGDRAAAIIHMEEAVRLAPDDTEARAMLEQMRRE